MTRQMQIGHRKRFLELQVRDGVESKNSPEHFQYISISSLNTITESQKELEEVLFKYDLKLKEMVDYKL